MGGALLICVGLAAWRWPSHVSTDEDQIRATLDSMARAAETHDVSAFASHVSEGFHDDSGGKPELRALLFGYLQNADFVAVILHNVQVTVEGSRAKASLVAILSRVQSAEPNEADIASGGVHRFAIDLAKEDGQWRVVQESHQPAGLRDALSP